MLGKLKHLEKTHRCKSVSGLVEADMRAATGPHVLEPVQLISPVFPQLFLYYLKLFFFASNQFGEGSCKSFHGPGENISAAGNNFWQWVLHDPAPIFDVILENPGSSFELAVHLIEAAQIHLKSMFWSRKIEDTWALWFWKIKLIIGTWTSGPFCGIIEKQKKTKKKNSNSCSAHGNNSTPGCDGLRICPCVK